MHILITTPSFYPDTGGVAEVAYRQYQYLISRGHKVEVITCHPVKNIDDEKIKQAGVTRLNIEMGGFPRYGAGDRLGVKRGENYFNYLNLLKQSRAEIVLTHCWQAWNTDWIFDSHCLTSVPIVLFSHGPSVNSKDGFLGNIRRWRWLNYAKRRIPRILNEVSAFCALEDCVDEDRFYDVLKARQLGINVIVIPNGYSPEIANLNLVTKKVNQRTILCVSQYTSKKNPGAVVHAFAQANPKDWDLIVSGSRKTAYAERLKRNINNYPIDMQKRIKLYYGLDKEKILSLYLEASIFISASKTECQPLVLIDAMSLGIPFITTKVGCVHKLVGGVAIDKISKLPGAITELVNDPFKRQKLSEAGLRAAKEKYNWDISLQKLESVLEKICAKSAAI